MILTITLNAALDITYDVPDLRVNGSHRVSNVRQRAGGKGINVSSVLTMLGKPCLATGFVGGSTGAQVLADLANRRIAQDFLDVDGESRRTINVVSAADGDATIFNEPGPVVAAAAWQGFLDKLDSLLAAGDCRVVVASGSLPPGVPADAYRQIVDAAHQAGAIAVIDADGGALLAALPAGPDVIKPNRHELAAAAGVDDPVAGARALQAVGASAVVASAGADGALVIPVVGEPLRGWLEKPLRGNPTGAGDAMVAGVAAGLESGQDWAGVLAAGIAWSAAAVLQPVAGEVSEADIAKLLPLVRIQPLGS